MISGRISLQNLKFLVQKPTRWSCHEQRSVSVFVVCCSYGHQPLLLWAQIQLWLISSYWNSRGPRSQSPGIRWICFFGHCASLAVALKLVRSHHIPNPCVLFFCNMRFYILSYSDYLSAFLCSEILIFIWTSFRETALKPLITSRTSISGRAIFFEFTLYSITFESLNLTEFCIRPLFFLFAARRPCRRVPRRKIPFDIISRLRQWHTFHFFACWPQTLIFCLLPAEGILSTFNRFRAFSTTMSHFRRYFW